MPTADWIIHAPSNYSWTPAEIAQIGRAAQAFGAELPTGGGKLVHLVGLEGLNVLDASILVNWPQPGESL